jgi:two-component sensor histidine kinase/HAMP domain-containing protein
VNRAGPASWDRPTAPAVASLLLAVCPAGGTTFLGRSCVLIVPGALVARARSRGHSLAPSRGGQCDRIVPLAALVLPIGLRVPGGDPGLAANGDVLLFGLVDVGVGLKISFCLLGIAALFGVVGWRSTVATNAVRVQIERLRHTSLEELAGAGDMLVALEEAQLAAMPLLASSRRERSSRGGGPADPRGSAGAAAAIEQGLHALEEKLDASRRVTEAALAMAEQGGDAATAARERQDISAWLDRIDVELAVHRSLVGQLLELARSDPEAARRYLDKYVRPHHAEVLQPLVRGYRDAADRELREALGVVNAILVASDRDHALLSVVALGLALVLGLFTTRTIAHPIAALRDAADRLWAGDLTVRVAGRSSDELGTLAADFNGMAEQLQTTMMLKSYVDDIIRSMSEIIVVTDLRGRVQTVNRAAVEQLGWSERELVGGDVRKVISGDSGAGEAQVVTRSGATLPVVCTPADLHDSAGRPHGRVWVARDRRRQKQVEEELRGLLAQKEALLREVHHRVKNNLQVISSLLRLQAAESPSPQAARLFHESESRIHSMALIHEQLCLSGDHTRINFRDYIDGLTRNVLASAGEMVRPVKVTLEVDPAPLDIDIAIACGLILNELLSNALKHAFPDGRGGTIAVTFACADGRATLVVADDGVGFPESPSGQAPAPSLGLRIVTALVRQLHGTSFVDGQGGTRFTLTFPIGGEPPAPVAQG